MVTLHILTWHGEYASMFYVKDIEADETLFSAHTLERAEQWLAEYLTEERG